MFILKRCNAVTFGRGGADCSRPLKVEAGDHTFLPGDALNELDIEHPDKRELGSPTSPSSPTDEDSPTFPIDIA